MSNKRSRYFANAIWQRKTTVSIFNTLSSTIDCKLVTFADVYNSVRNASSITPLRRAFYQLGLLSYGFSIHNRLRDQTRPSCSLPIVACVMSSIQFSQIKGVRPAASLNTQHSCCLCGCEHNPYNSSEIQIRDFASVFELWKNSRDTASKSDDTSSLEPWSSTRLARSSRQLIYMNSLNIATTTTGPSFKS
jgi:hypothetical protein